jgi:deoxyribodipyrimidine photo-lyase
LEDLNKKVNNCLNIETGIPSIIINKIIKKYKVSYVSINGDFTLYAIKRQKEIEKVCNDNNVALIINNDNQSLAPMEMLVKSDGNPYLIYGSFYKNEIKHIQKPQASSKKVKWVSIIETPNFDNIRKKYKLPTYGANRDNINLKQRMNRAGAKDLLSINEDSSLLSAALNFGLISIRECWQATTKHEAKRSLIWRDHYLCIFRYHPRGNQYKSIDQRYDLIKWPKVNKNEWKSFIECRTGFLLIDACMKALQSNNTENHIVGFIDNRARLLLATFWIKYLLISPFDKKYGSQIWFSKLLYDCSASQNKMNHLWILGDSDLSGRRYCMKNTHPMTGRMIRIDNDMIKKYDPNCEYIKKWLPEYKNMSKKEILKNTKPIFNWTDRYLEYAKLFENIPR